MKTPTPTTTDRHTRYPVFVYGSLLKGFGNHLFHLGNETRDREVSTAPEYTMHDLGSFPGVCEGGTSAIAGEVYLVNAHGLAKLDRLEGHPSFYRRTWVTLADGRPSYIYLLPRERCAALTRVESGSWREYTETRTARRSTDLAALVTRGMIAVSEPAPAYAIDVVDAFDDAEFARWLEETADDATPDAEDGDEIASFPVSYRTRLRVIRDASCFRVDFWDDESAAGEPLDFFAFAADATAAAQLLADNPVQLSEDYGVVV